MDIHPVAAVNEVLIRGYIKQGLSGRGIMSLLRGQGLSFRTTEMLAALRTFKGVWKFQEQITRLIPERLIPKAFQIEKQMGRGAAYRYFGEATFRIVDTGEIYTRSISWYSNQADQKRLIEEEYLDDYPQGQYDPTEEIVSVDLKQVMHDPDFPY